MIASGAVEAAQSLPGSVQPGRDRTLPRIDPPPPAADFRIEAPRRSPIPRDVDTVHFKLNGVRVIDAGTIPSDSYFPLYKDLIGKEVTLSAIFDVADSIERIYRQAGYLLVRAYVPPQKVNDGIFTIKVVEGYVSTVSVEGGNDAVRARVERYLQPVLASKPLKLSVIERALLLANDIPGVTAAGVLRAAANTPGASDLIVTIAQPRISGAVAIDNRGSRFSGHWTVEGGIMVSSILDGADQLSASLTLSPNSLERIGGSLGYRIPIGDDGFAASMRGVITHGEPGSTLRAFNVITDSYAVGPRLSYPLIRSRSETLALDAGFTLQDANVSILGSKLSHDRWRVVDVSASYVRNDFLGGTLGASVNVAKGLQIFGATRDGAPEISRLGSTTDFTKVSGGAWFSRTLIDDFSMLFASQAQYAFDPLITGEQITFGGTQIGRGYDPGAITGDHGVGGSIEVRYDKRLSDLFIVALQPYVFFDAATGWYINEGAAFDPSLRSQTLESFGGGVRTWLQYNTTLGIEVDHTLRSVPGSDGGKRATKVSVNAAIRF